MLDLAGSAIRGPVLGCEEGVPYKISVRTPPHRE